METLNNFQEEINDKHRIKKWEDIQKELSLKVIDRDVGKFQSQEYRPTLIAGVDLSYFVDDNSRAYVTLVVMKDTDINRDQAKLIIVYSHSTYLENITIPYIPGFLGFREVDYINNEFQILKQTSPDLLPEVVLVDGNGILHPRYFGSASHLGLFINTPTIGVAKNPYMFEGGLVKSEISLKNKLLVISGDTYHITHNNKTLGVALKSNPKTKSPIYVSIGHKISLETSIKLVLRFCLFRVPEPVRQADIISREFVRIHKTL